jgi:hypothetical protein
MEVIDAIMFKSESTAVCTWLFFGYKFGTASSVKYQLSIYSVVSISASSYSFD